MTQDATAPAAAGSSLPWLSPALLPLAAFVAMYLPVYRDLANTLWTSEDQAHGPMVGVVCLWLAWQRRHALLALAPAPAAAAGLGLFTSGLLLYVVGVSQDIVPLTLLSQILVLAGSVLALRGSAALRELRFPLGYLVFMIPLPGFLIDSLTQPLKRWVTWAADQILYHLGYPIAHEGVTIVIGQYQLLVADACSGLRSLVALTAMAVLFIHITGRSSRLHQLLMLAAIVPLALLANLLRVIVLVLLTWYYGEDVAQGFLHGTAGMLVFLAALAGLFGWDALLAHLIPARSTAARP